LDIRLDSRQNFPVSLAPERLICTNKNHGSDEFVKTTRLKVLDTISGTSVLQAANKFCKPGERIRELSSKCFSEIYQVFEFDCNRRSQARQPTMSDKYVRLRKSSKISDGPHLNSMRRSGLDG
jgi:hypothetical protein